MYYMVQVLIFKTRNVYILLLNYNMLVITIKDLFHFDTQSFPTPIQFMNFATGNNFQQLNLIFVVSEGKA